MSKELFLQVNGLLDQNAHGYKLVEEKPAIPLKRFVYCEDCGRLMRGYLAKKKASIIISGIRSGAVIIKTPVS